MSNNLNSIGLEKKPSETTVVVAMSGGVDSSVVAAKLASEGYDVIGVTLQLYDHGAALAKKGACCAGIDIHDARRVAESMNFPHYVLDYENIFKEISWFTGKVLYEGATCDPSDNFMFSHIFFSFPFILLACHFISFHFPLISWLSGCLKSALCISMHILTSDPYGPVFQFLW